MKTDPTVHFVGLVDDLTEEIRILVSCALDPVETAAEMLAIEETPDNDNRPPQTPRFIEEMVSEAEPTIREVMELSLFDQQSLLAETPLDFAPRNSCDQARAVENLLQATIDDLADELEFKCRLLHYSNGMECPND